MKTTFTFEELRMTVTMMRNHMVTLPAEMEYHVRRVLDYIEEYIEESEYQYSCTDSDYVDLNIWLSVLICEDEYILDKSQCRNDFNTEWETVTNTDGWLSINID